MTELGDVELIESNPDSGNNVNKRWQGIVHPIKLNKTYSEYIVYFIVGGLTVC